jgi:hypothetical protein
MSIRIKAFLVIPNWCLLGSRFDSTALYVRILVLRIQDMQRIRYLKVASFAVLIFSVIHGSSQPPYGSVVLPGILVHYLRRRLSPCKRSKGISCKS